VRALCNTCSAAVQWRASRAAARPPHTSCFSLIDALTLSTAPSSPTARLPIERFRKRALPSQHATRVGAAAPLLALSRYGMLRGGLAMHPVSATPLRDPQARMPYMIQLFSLPSAVRSSVCVSLCACLGHDCALSWAHSRCSLPRTARRVCGTRLSHLESSKVFGTRS